MVAPSKALDVCVDACVLINLAIVGRVDLLALIHDMVFHVPQEVLDEITVDEQRRQIEAAVASGGLRLARIEAVEELQAFAEYAGQFGKGESACLAIASCRKWVVGTDETKDKRLAREISASGIQVINTPGVLLTAIRQGVLSVNDADAIKVELERHRFTMSFDTFRGLVGLRTQRCGRR
jgi:predicted nucleic acid-binding protein